MERKRALIIDANLFDIHYIKQRLEKLNLEVEIAHTDVKGFSLAKSFRPDLFFVDVATTRKNKCELFHSLFGHPLTKNIPVFFISVPGKLLDTLQKACKAPFAAVSKPVRFEEIEPHLTRLLEYIPDAKPPEQVPDVALQGRLESFPISEIMQLITTSRQSFSVALRTVGDQGHLWFKSGVLVDAESKEHSGVEAAYEILTWTEGSFKARLDVSVRERNIFEGHHSIVLEALRRQDERQAARENWSIGIVEDSFGPEESERPPDSPDLKGEKKETRDEVEEPSAPLRKLREHSSLG